MRRIKELRKEKSMNQIALGMELNFSQKIISEYENGKVEPSITTLKKLASIFNTSVDYIIEYTDIKQPIDKIAQSELSETECKLLNEFRCLPKRKTKHCPWYHYGIKARLIVANIILFVSCLHTIRLTNEVRRYSMTVVLRSL